MSDTLKNQGDRDGQILLPEADELKARPLGDWAKDKLFYVSII